MSSEELKPCPFCGFHPSVTDDDCIYPVTMDRKVWSLHCYETGGGCSAAVLGGSPEECIALWNTRAQLAAIQGGMGEEVEVVAWRHFGDASRLLCDLGKQRSVPGDYAAEFNIPLMTVAQHQRITAAMAAEVERLSRMLNNATNDGIKLADERDALRAELAEVKGREAVAWVNPKFLSSNDLLIYASHQQLSKEQVPLYASPSASPDVEGLVKALQRLLSWSDRQVCTHEETHRGGAIWEICDMCGAKWADDEGGKPELKWPDEIEGARTALSTWRHAQEGKP